MSLTKKHFIGIAEILRFAKSRHQIDTNVLITLFSDYFKIENPLFDEQRFKKACKGDLK